MCIIKRKVNQLKRWNTWRSAPHTCSQLGAAGSKRASGIPLAASRKKSRSQIHMSDAASHIDEFESCRLPDTLRPPARPLAKSRCAQPWKDWAGLLLGNCRKKVDFMCDNRTDLLCARTMSKQTTLACNRGVEKNEVCSILRRSQILKPKKYQSANNFFNLLKRKYNLTIVSNVISQAENFPRLRQQERHT